jgi:hypothetical protein
VTSDFRTTGRKQHDFPKVTFTLDGIFKAYGDIILQLEVNKLNSLGSNYQYIKKIGPLCLHPSNFMVKINTFFAECGRGQTGRGTTLRKYCIKVVRTTGTNCWEHTIQPWF